MHMTACASLHDTASTVVSCDSIAECNKLPCSGVTQFAIVALLTTMGLLSRMHGRQLEGGFL